MSQDGLQILGGGAHPSSGAAGGALAGEYPNPSLSSTAKHLFPQLLVAGTHIETFGVVEMPALSGEVEIEHGLPSTPANVQLTVLDEETLEAADVDVTLKALSSTKITLRRSASVHKIKVHWRAIT